MVDVKLPQDVAERVGRVDPKKTLIAGVRPEDFEDAQLVGPDQRDRGTTFKTKFDLVEAMGAEYYVHFSAGEGTVESAQVDDLLADQGGVAELSDQGAVVVARLNAESKARVGDATELWIDASKMHFFDAETGQNVSDS
jgi:multiple sugar transport system ATP-binding protein